MPRLAAAKDVIQDFGYDPTGILPGTMHASIKGLPCVGVHGTRDADGIFIPSDDDWLLTETTEVTLICARHDGEHQNRAIFSEPLDLR